MTFESPIFIRTIKGHVEAFVASLVLFPMVVLGQAAPVTGAGSTPHIGAFYDAKPATIDGYTQWLNRDSIWLHLYFPRCKTWSDVDTHYVVDPQWVTWLKAVPGRQLLLGMALLVDDKASSLTEGATGAYDEHFKTVAKNLAAAGLGDAIICIGPTNGWGLPERLAKPEDSTTFVAYWQHVVAAMKSVPGAEHLRFLWNPGAPAAAQALFVNAYPGDDSVDYVGRTFYEGGGGYRSIYPYPPRASESERVYRQKKAWATQLPGLNWWRDFAKTHHKPYVVFWGIGADHTSSSGDDAQYFIQAMHDYVFDPANDIDASIFWESGQTAALRGPNVAWRRSSPLYQQLFGLPVAAPPGAPKVPGQ